METCRLCLRLKPLRDSHLVSKFVTDWIKRTSVTGKLRPATAPNLRIQDSPKIKLLCEDCEQLLSRYEQYFSGHIFRPVLESLKPTIQYDERLLKFAVSLSWRTYQYCAQSMSWRNRIIRTHAEETAEAWRDFLLNDVSLRDGEHHCLMLRLVPDADNLQGTNVNINWYFFRAIDTTMAQNNEEAFVYTKLPGFAFLSTLVPGPFQYLAGTLIKKNGSFDFYSQQVSRTIFSFLFTRHEAALSPIAQLTKDQKKRIEDDYLKNHNRVADSYGFKVYLAQEISRQKKP